MDNYVTATKARDLASTADFETVKDSLDRLNKRLRDLSCRYAQSTSRLCRFESDVAGARPSKVEAVQNRPPTTSLLAELEETCCMFELNLRLFDETVARLTRNTE